MIIFNTTFNTEKANKDEFVEYLKNTYIPQAMESGKLRDPRLAEILSDEENPESINLALQFTLDSIDALNSWYVDYSPVLNKDLVNRFGRKVVGFSTVMKEYAL